MIWYLIAASAAAIPIPLIKKYTLTDEKIWLIFSAISYIILIYSYSIVLRDENISIIYPFLKVLSVLIVVSVGILAFNEKINLLNSIGIILGILSIYILSI